MQHDAPPKKRSFSNGNGPPGGAANAADWLAGLPWLSSHWWQM